MGNLHGQQERAEKIIRDYKQDEWDKANETLSFFRLQYLLHSKGLFLEIGEVYDILYKEVKDESKD